MGSFTQLTYHVVFGTKFRARCLTESIQDRLYEYMGGTIRAKKGQLIQIGGMPDHVHILARLSPALSVAEVIRDVKANSSKWLNQLKEFASLFEWQIGYGAFTVSYERIDAVRNYIQNQKEHHRVKTFQEEYIDFLERHNISFQKEYLFEREHHG